MRAGAGFALVALLALVAEGDVSGVANSRAVGGAEVGAAARTSARGFRYSQWLQDKDAYSTPTLLTDTASSALNKPGSFWGDVAGRLRAGAVDRARDSLINAAYRGESLAELMLRHHRGGEFDMREWLEINRRQVGDRIGAILPAFYRDAEGVLAGALSDAAAELAFVERARISFETALGGRKATGGVEAAGALAQRESYVVGWQLRAFAGEDSAKGLNSGLFYRRVVNDLGFFDDSLAGVNLFLDFEDGDLGDFWRWSIGGDLKSYLGELSANRYFAITDAQKDARGNDVYTRSGYDFDFALNIPRVEWAKARVGYYNFEGEFGDEDDSGLRAGLDLHPGHGLVVGLQYDDNGGEFGGNVSYTHKFGEASAGASRPAEFDPRAHFFDTVRREYSQRITRAGSGNNNVVIVSSNVNVALRGNVAFAVSGTTTVTATNIVAPAAGTVINFGFPLGASAGVTISTATGTDRTLAIRRGSRWFMTLFGNTEVALLVDASSAVSVTLSVTRGMGILDRNSGMSLIRLAAGTVTLIGTRLHFDANNRITLYEGEVVIPQTGISVVAGDRTTVRIGNISATAASCANIVAGVSLRCEIANASASYANATVIAGEGTSESLGMITLSGAVDGISVSINRAGFFHATVNNNVIDILVNPMSVEASRTHVVVDAMVSGEEGTQTPRTWRFTAVINPADIGVNWTGGEPNIVPLINNVNRVITVGTVLVSGGFDDRYIRLENNPRNEFTFTGADNNILILRGDNTQVRTVDVLVVGDDRNAPNTRAATLSVNVQVVDAVQFRRGGRYNVLNDADFSLAITAIGGVPFATPNAPYTYTNPTNPPSLPTGIRLENRGTGGATGPWDIIKDNSVTPQTFEWVFVANDNNTDLAATGGNSTTATVTLVVVDRINAGANFRGANLSAVVLADTELTLGTLAPSRGAGNYTYAIRRGNARFASDGNSTVVVATVPAGLQTYIFEIDDRFADDSPVTATPPVLVTFVANGVPPVVIRPQGVLNIAVTTRGALAVGRFVISGGDGNFGAPPLTATPSGVTIGGSSLDSDGNLVMTAGAGAGNAIFLIVGDDGSDATPAASLTVTVGIVEALVDASQFRSDTVILADTSVTLGTLAASGGGNARTYNVRGNNAVLASDGNSTVVVANVRPGVHTFVFVIDDTFNNAPVDETEPLTITFGVSAVAPLVINAQGNIRAAVPQSVTTGIGQVRLSGGEGAYTYSASGSGVSDARVVIDSANGNLSVVAGAGLGNLVVVVIGNDTADITPAVMLTFTVAIVEALNLRFEGVASPVVVTTGNGVNAGADIGAVVAQSPNAVSQLRIFSGGQYVNLTRNGDRGALRYIGNTANPAQGAQVVIEARDAEDTARITLLLNIVNPPDVQLNIVGSPRLTRGTVDAAITAATLAASGGFALDTVEPSMRIVVGANLFDFNPSSGVLILRAPNLQGRTVQAVIEAADAHRGAAVARVTVQVAVSPLELRAGADFVAVKVPRAAADGRLNLFTVRALGGSGARVLGAVGSPFVFDNPDAEGAREVYLPAGDYAANLGDESVSVWSFAVRQLGGEVLQRVVTAAWVRELGLDQVPQQLVNTMSVNVQRFAANVDIAGGAGAIVGAAGTNNIRLLNEVEGWSYAASNPRTGGGFVRANHSTPGVKAARLTFVVDDTFNGAPVPQTPPFTFAVTLQVTVFADLAFSDITVTVTAGALAPARRIISGGVAPYTILWGGQGNSEVSIGGGLSRDDRDQRGETETITEDNFAAPFYPDTFMQMDAEGYLHVRGVSDSETRAGNNVTERITVRDAAANEMVADVVVRYVDTIPALGMNLVPAVTVYRVGEEFKAADINFTGGAQVAGAGDFAAARIEFTGGPAALTSDITVINRVTSRVDGAATQTVTTPSRALAAVGNELRSFGGAAGTITAQVIGSNFKDTLTSSITVEFVAPLAVAYPSIEIIRTVIVDANAPATPPGPGPGNLHTMPPDLRLSLITVSAALSDGANVQLQVGNIPADMALVASGGGGATPTYTFTPSGAFGGGVGLGAVSFTPTSPGSYRGQVIVANEHNGYTQRVTSVVNISIEAGPAVPRKSLYVRFVNDLPANARSRPDGTDEVIVGTLAVFGVGGEIGLDTLPANFTSDPIADGITLTFNTPANFGGNTNIPVNTQPEIEASAFVLKHTGAAPANDVAIVATTDAPNATPGTLFVRLRAGALLLTSTGEPVFYLIDNMPGNGHRVFSITAMGGLSPYKFEPIAAASPFAQVHSSEGVNARTLRLYNGNISDTFQTGTPPALVASESVFEVSDAAGMSATLRASVYFVKPIQAQVRGGYGVLLKGASQTALAAEIEMVSDGAGRYTYTVMSGYPAGYFTMDGANLMGRIPASDSRPLFIVTVRVDDGYEGNVAVDATPPLHLKVSVYANNPLLAPAATVTVFTRAIGAGEGVFVRPSGGYGPYQLANVSPDTGGNIGSGGLLSINTDNTVFGDLRVNYVNRAVTRDAVGVVSVGEVMIIDSGVIVTSETDNEMNIPLITQTTTIPVHIRYVNPPQMSIAAHDIVQTAGVEFGVNVRVLGGIIGNKSIVSVLGISGGTIVGAVQMPRGDNVQATLRGDSEGELLLTVRVADAHPAIADLDVVLRARIVSGLGLEVLPFALPSAGQLFTVSLNVRGGDSRVVSFVSNPGNNGSYVRYDFNGAVVLRAGNAGNMRIVVQASDETPATPILRTIEARVLDGFHFTNQRSAPITVTTSFPGDTNFQLPHLQFAAVGRAGSPSYDIPEILITNRVINPGAGEEALVTFTAAARYSLNSSGVLSYIGEFPPFFPTDDEVILRAQSAGQTALGVITIRYVYPRAVEVAFADPRQTLRFNQGGAINIGRISIGGGFEPARRLHLVGASDFSLVTTGGNVELRLGGDNSRARTVQAVIRGTDGHHGSYDGFLTARVTVNNMPVMLSIVSGNLRHGVGGASVDFVTISLSGGLDKAYSVRATPADVEVSPANDALQTSYITVEVQTGMLEGRTVFTYQRQRVVTPVSALFYARIGVQSERTVPVRFTGMDGTSAPDGVLDVVVTVKDPEGAIGFAPAGNFATPAGRGAFTVGTVTTGGDFGTREARIVNQGAIQDFVVRITGGVTVVVMPYPVSTGSYVASLFAVQTDATFGGRTVATLPLTVQVAVPRPVLSGPGAVAITSIAADYLVGDNLNVATITFSGGAPGRAVEVEGPVRRDEQAKLQFLNWRVSGNEVIFRITNNALSFYPPRPSLAEYMAQVAAQQPIARRAYKLTMFYGDRNASSNDGFAYLTLTVGVLPIQAGFVRIAGLVTASDAPTVYAVAPPTEPLYVAAAARSEVTLLADTIHGGNLNFAKVGNGAGWNINNSGVLDFNFQSGGALTVLTVRIEDSESGYAPYHFVFTVRIGGASRLTVWTHRANSVFITSLARGAAPLRFDVYDRNRSIDADGNAVRIPVGSDEDYAFGAPYENVRLRHNGDLYYADGFTPTLAATLTLSAIVRMRDSSPTPVDATVFRDLAIEYIHAPDAAMNVQALTSRVAVGKPEAVAALNLSGGGGDLTVRVISVGAEEVVINGQTAGVFVEERSGTLFVNAGGAGMITASIIAFDSERRNVATATAAVVVEARERLRLSGFVSVPVDSAFDLVFNGQFDVYRGQSQPTSPASPEDIRLRLLASDSSPLNELPRPLPATGGTGPYTYSDPGNGFTYTGGTLSYAANTFGDNHPYDIRTIVTVFGPADSNGNFPVQSIVSVTSDFHALVTLRATDSAGDFVEEVATVIFKGGGVTARPATLPPVAVSYDYNDILVGKLTVRDDGMTVDAPRQFFGVGESDVAVATVNVASGVTPATDSRGFRINTAADTHLLLFTDANAAIGAHYATVTADDSDADTAPGTVYATLTLAPQITPLTATVTVVQGSQSRGIVGTLRAQGGTPPYGFIPQGLDVINAEVQPVGPASLRAVGVKSDGEIRLLANPNLQTPGLFTLANIEISDNTPAPYNTRKATAQMLLLSVAPPPPSLQITVSYSNLSVTTIVTNEVAAYTITNIYGEDADAENGFVAVPTMTATIEVAASTTRITSRFLSGGAVRMQFGNGNVSLSVAGYSPGDLALSDDFPRALTARLSRRALARITIALAAPNGGSATRVLSLQMNGGAPRIAEYLLSSELTVAIGASGVGTVDAANVELMGVAVSDNSYQFSVEAVITDTTSGYDYSRTRLQVITVNNNRRLRVESIPGSARFNYRIHVWHNGFATNAPGQFGATDALPLQIAQTSTTTPVTLGVDNGDVSVNRPDYTLNALLATFSPSGGNAPYTYEVKRGNTFYTTWSARFPSYLNFNFSNGQLRTNAGPPRNCRRNCQDRPPAYRFINDAFGGYSEGYETGAISVIIRATDSSTPPQQALATVTVNYTN